MEILTQPLGAYATNCHIITDETATVIDPADNAEKIKQLLDEKGVKIGKILLTHGHLDHILAAQDLAEYSGADIYIHKADYHMISDVKAVIPKDPLLVQKFKPVSNAMFIKEGDKIPLGGETAEVLETPGHTPGSVMYLLRQSGVIFTGDTIFKLSVGRTDTEMNFTKMLNSIKRLYDFNSNFTLYSGHGPQTALYFEMKNNPFFLPN